MSPVNDGLFSSIKQNWETPQEVFDLLDSYFHFELDAAASLENTKCKKFFSKENSGLSHHWSPSTFLNPPYDDIEIWMRKVTAEAINNTVVCLVPARTDTKWFREYCWSYAKTMVFIYGRLSFGSGGKSIGTAPFPSVIVVYNYNILLRGEQEDFERRMFSLGKVIYL